MHNQAKQKLKHEFVGVSLQGKEYGFHHRKILYLVTN